jgi:hypothetical protein
MKELILTNGLNNLKRNKMSGGHWDYIQHRFTDVAEDIDKLVEQNGKPKTKEELKEEYWHGDDWYNKYPEELNHHKYPDEVIEEFKTAVITIGIAQIYIQRIDWLLSGDDGEESFLKRIDEDLEKIGIE